MFGYLSCFYDWGSSFVYWDTVCHLFRHALSGELWQAQPSRFRMSLARLTKRYKCLTACRTLKGCVW